jgi:putative aldouronate transport system substrate-binding protein
MFLDRLMEDKSYNYLIYFGIEGKHYTIKDGKINLNPAISDYPVDAAGFWFTDKNQHLALANWTPQYASLRSDIVKKGFVVDYPLSALNVDTTAIKNEVAAVNQVLIQYYQPIEVGAVPDVDAALKTLQQKLKAAGVDAIQAECQKQINAYLAASK